MRGIDELVRTRRAGGVGLARRAGRRCRAALGRVLVLGGLAAGLAGAAFAAVQVQARLQRSTIALGESTTLEVTVSGGMSGVQQPEVALPAGVEILGSGREESLQFVNGRMDRQVIFRYELGAQQAGRYTVGPIRVRVGGTDYLSGAVALTVLSSLPRASAPGREPVWLGTEVRPTRAWVGQEMMLTVKLLQRTTLAQDPEYMPPSTPGFWSDRASPPESYYADAGNQRVLVTETRTRLYPLTAGRLTIGPAQALVVLPAQNETDPFNLLGGRVGRQVELHSDSLRVQVAPLPRPEPGGFGGAVGQFETRWGVDRARPALDTPFTVTLELRGSGNLPLARAPEWAPQGCEVYARQVDDSLGQAGTSEPGRKRVQWTVLARRTGRLQLEPPTLAWFDPQAGQYRTAELPALTLDVTPPALASAGGTERYPEALLSNPASPGATGPTPWAWAIAGLLLGAALRALQRAGAPDTTGADRARAAGWRRALEAPARSPDWWRAADDAVAWLAERGRLVHRLRQQIHAARYGGQTSSEAEVRIKVLEHLEAAAPPPPQRWPLRGLSLFMAGAAIVLAAVMGPRPADSRLAAQAQQAEAWARRGDWDRARERWQELWQESGDAGAAARLAWASLQAGETGPATLWTLRGWLRNPRDPALRWVAQRVRESGGLRGEPGTTWWPSALEAAIAALLAGAAAAWFWRRRRAPWGGGMALALAAALAMPAWDWAQHRIERVVVTGETELVPASGERLTVEPGQVLRVRARRGRGLDVSAGPEVEGMVDRSRVAWVSEERTRG